MKLTIVLTILLTVNTFASVYSQTTRLSVELENTSLQELFEKIADQSDFQFIYNDEEIREVKNLNARFEGATVEYILETVLRDVDLEYKVINDVVVIVPSPGKTSKRHELEKAGQQKKIIRGKVTDESGAALPGVSIVVAGTQVGIATRTDGTYELELPEGAEKLTISFIGMETQEVVIGDKLLINVTLKPDLEEIGDVVVTGYFARKAESYTGSATVIKGETIKEINPMNVFESIAILDPDVVIQENNLIGSDPNNLKSFYIQGTGSFDASAIGTRYASDFVGDPNLPTFILDGFEVSFETVNDLDPNRIESLVLLKDAAATAVYGSRASNGVIVITTVAPKPGRIDVIYNSNVQFSFPDLSTYDLLKASEKFELQQQLGVTTPTGIDAHEHNRISKWLAQGVETDWMAKPTRNGVSQNHTLNLMGGVRSLRYNLGINYSGDQGVMKGSSRDNYSVNADIHYRPSDKLTFKNSVTYSKVQKENSPYGSFSTYTLMNPFFPVYDLDGNMIKEYWTKPDDGQASKFTSDYGAAINTNPLWEANIGNYDKGEYSLFRNNFGLDWTFIEGLRLQLQLYYSEKNETSNRFLSPRSQYFTETKSPAEKGSNAWSTTKTLEYSGRTSLGYIKQVGKHSITANVGYEMYLSDSEMIGFNAVGFGRSDMSFMGYAAGYQPKGLPSANEATIRTLGGYLSVNYTWDNRFLFDGSVRFDGSSQFGKNKRIAPFYSGGIGWNLHEESFLENNPVINQLRLRSTIGQTGSVKFRAYQAYDTYNYYRNSRYLGTLGFYILTLGNENLSWQKTNEYNLGLDLSMFKNRLSINANYYYKKTKDMVIDVSVPPSLGFTSYSENLGEMENRGFNFSARVNIISEQDINLSVFANGTSNKNKILAISNSLERFNDDSNSAHTNATDSHNYFTQFREGESTTAIYAVRSLGIDPLTGKELYVTKEGNTTFDWNPEDKIIVGDRTPDLQGAFGVNLRYKRIIASANFQYSVGSQAYNTSLVHKVENINIRNNVDRRVLTDAWLKPGDDAKFKNPNGAHTYQSSRFVQDNDWLRFSSLSISYDLGNETFIKKLGMNSLRFTVNTNDLFHLTSIPLERGTNYPFARSFTLGLRANF